MNSKRWLAAVLFGLAAGTAGAAELRMQWQGLNEDQRTIDLAVGQEAVIDLWLTLSDGDMFVNLFYSNEAVANVAQVSTQPNASLGIADASTDGALGSGGQQVVFGTSGGMILEGPGEFRLGSQTVRLTGPGSGGNAEIAFQLGTLAVLDGTGAEYNRVAGGTAFSDLPGFYHIAAGSPGYSDSLGGVDTREPLVVRVPSDGGGGDGGDGSGGGNENDNGATGGDDNENDNGGGVGDDNDNGSPNDNGLPNENDNDSPNGNDNVSPNDNDNGSPNGNDNGSGGVDNANDNAPPNDNDTGQPNDNGGGGGSTNGNGGQNDNSSDGGSPPSRGPCGLGTVAVLPIILTALWLLQPRRRCGQGSV